MPFVVVTLHPTTWAPHCLVILMSRLGKTFSCVYHWHHCGLHTLQTYVTWFTRNIWTLTAVPLLPSEHAMCHWPGLFWWWCHLRQHHPGPPAHLKPHAIWALVPYVEKRVIDPSDTVLCQDQTTRMHPGFWHDCHCRQISSIRPEYELNYCLQQCRTTNGPLLRDILEEQLWGAWDVPLQPDEKSSISECFDTSYAVFQCRQIGWLSTL